MVENVDIKSKTKTIQDCFRECLYEVPNFQRPYSWGNDQLEDYWSDVALAKSDFFFGTTVTWVSRERDLFSNTYSLIDGQQRITTSTIALSVIRDSFSDLKLKFNGSEEWTAELEQAAKVQFDNTQKYIVVSDDDSTEYPVLTRREPSFWDKIQRPNAIPTELPDNESTKFIAKARSFFENKVRSHLEDANLEGSIENLKSLRNNILKARVIQVELSSEEDAFLIFETLNTRGAELQLSDLIKNMLVRGVSGNSRDRETVSNRWESLANAISGNGDNLDALSRFIWHSWGSRNKAVKEPELYKKVKSHLGSDATRHYEYLQHLETDARLYKYLDGVERPFPSARRGTRIAMSIPDVQDSLRALAVFNVSVANAALIAIARKFESSNFMTQRQLKSAMRDIENFHFHFTALTKSGSTGGTRARYNNFSVSLQEATNKQEVDDAILDLRRLLVRSLPSVSKSIEGFCELFYAPGERLSAANRRSGSRELIEYVLLTMAKYDGALPASQNRGSWTIEHIRPQSRASADISDPVYSIGNLTLLTERINSSIGNGTFSEKRSFLKSYARPVDEKLNLWLGEEDMEDPSDELIRERAHSLAELAVTKVWKISDS